MKYGKEFKEEALKLSGLKKTAQQLWIQYYTLADWRKDIKAALNRPKPSDSEAAKRIKELERENAELRKANDILKEALSFS